MKSDSDIKRDVEEELRFDPDIDATDIGVSVNNGVRRPHRLVKSYTEKFEAEAAAKRVAGVLGLANDLEVRLPGGTERPDPDIARDVVAAIKTRLPFTAEHIRAVVKNGWVTLEGQVEWNYQREIGGKRGAPYPREIKGRHQPDPAEAAGRAERDQAQDRGSVSPQRGNRRQPHHRRDEWRRSDPERHRPFLGRTAGSRTRRLGGAGSNQGGEPPHDQPLAPVRPAGGVDA